MADGRFSVVVRVLREQARWQTGNVSALWEFGRECISKRNLKFRSVDMIS